MVWLPLSAMPSACYYSGIVRRVSALSDPSTPSRARAMLQSVEGVYRDGKVELVEPADNLGTGLPQLIVVMITGNLARTGHPSRVSVSLATPAGQQTGLKRDSVIMTDNLATIFETEIDRVIGTWLDMPAVDAALR